VSGTAWTIIGVLVVFAALLLMGRWLYRSSRRVPGEPEVVPESLREVAPFPAETGGAEPEDDVYAPRGTRDHEVETEGEEPRP
jgi:hypothetical protein